MKAKQRRRRESEGKKDESNESWSLIIISIHSGALVPFFRAWFFLLCRNFLEPFHETFLLIPYFQIQFLQIDG